MVGIDMVVALPSERGNGGIGLAAHILRVRADRAVFPVRLVPDRHDGDPGLLRHYHRLELRLALAGKAVTDAK